MTSFLAVLLPAMAAAVFGGATPAAAWGHDGHWLTAALADSLLTETASAAMYSILGEADNLTTVRYGVQEERDGRRFGFSP